MSKRSPTRWRSLTLSEHGLCLLVFALCTIALSHVPVDSTITAIREQVPPVLAFIYPLLAGLTPLWLRRQRSDSNPFLLLAAASLPLSGALLLLDGPTALCLASLALLEQLSRGAGRVPLKPVLLAGLSVVGLLALATLFGRNPLHASPSFSWILAASLLMLAVAARPRSPEAIRRLLLAPLFVALVVALCGLVLKGFLALNVDLHPALNTRLTLFRQHPNFLAPFFAFQTLIACGLAMSSSKHRAQLLISAVLLAASTWATDSRSGKALLILGLAGMVLLPTVRRIVAHFSRRALVSAAALVLFLLATGVWGLSTERGQELSASSLDRFETSLDYRLDAWRNALAVIESQPWLGVGPHTFVSQYRFQPGSRFFNEPTSPHPHNVTLYVAQSAGLPAMVLFLLWALLLMAALWKRPPPSHAALAPRLADALLAALVALLLANQLDVGLALDTVVPEPFFLLTGIILATTVRPKATSIRLGYGLLWLAGLAVILLPIGLDGVAARRYMEQARLQVLQSASASGSHSTMADAIASAERALELDPNLEHCYELLARWYESQPAGFPVAHNLLQRLSDRAPQYGAARAMLGHLYMRAKMFPEAADTLSQALDDEHGSIHQNRNRADAIMALCKTGRRTEALERLVEGLSLDVGVIEALSWVDDSQTGKRILNVGGLDDQGPISLNEAIEILHGQHIKTHSEGGLVGRKNWMDTFLAFQRAGAAEQAHALLDYFESDVPIVERHTILHERGRLFMEQDEPAQALSCFEQVRAMTGNIFYQADILRARQAMGEHNLQPQTSSSPESTIAQLDEILDQPWAFEHNLEVLADVQIEAGNPGAAAEFLERTLLYRDDVVGRAARWEEVGDLYLAAGNSSEALRSYEEALMHWGAKPYPITLLQIDLGSSKPGRIARSMARAWRAQGHRPEDVVAQAWSLKDFFSHRTSWSFFRAALFSEAGQMDALLREAELQLLTDPDNLLAGWFRVEALEGLGRHGEVPGAMRALSERYYEISPISLDRLYAQAVADGQNRTSDPEAWRAVATVELLRGRYNESASLFIKALDLVPPGEGQLFAELAVLQARAELLSATEGSLEIVRELLSAAVDAAPDTLSFRRRLETLP